MTKSELSERIANKTGMKRKMAATAVDFLLEEIRDALASGDKVQLIPFGSFEVRERQAREGRNPRSGEKIKIKARKVPTFRPGKALKEAIGHHEPAKKAPAKKAAAHGHAAPAKKAAGKK
ncbi:MAG TPA: HU family DNA-binding protein [Candidatus Xenobia bacterium]